MENTPDIGKIIKDQLEKVKYAMGELEQIKKKNMETEVPLEKKDANIEDKKIWISRHVGGMVTFHFSTESDAMDFFKTIN